MILYGIDNIRELSGHKVRLVPPWRCDDVAVRLIGPMVQVNLNTVRKNPVCRLGL